VDLEHFGELLDRAHHVLVAQRTRPVETDEGEEAALDGDRIRRAA
jgi:hypothetical protein